MYGIFNIFHHQCDFIVTNLFINPKFDIIQSPRITCVIFWHPRSAPISIANWIIKNKGTSTQRSSFCAQLYSTEGSSGSLDIVLNHHKMGCSAC